MEPAYSDINGSENYLDRFDESNNCELYDTECRLIKIVIYLTVNNFLVHLYGKLFMLGAMRCNACVVEIVVFFAMLSLVAT